MRIFAIGDLHLGHAVDKPMDIFGPEWKDHPARIADAWRDRVGENDVVLIPGDVSWAMRMEEVLEDLRYLDALPGRKFIIKGNHDYWWGPISRLRRHLAGTSIHPLQYDSASIGQVAVGGTRLWTLPGMEEVYLDPLEVIPGKIQVSEMPGEGAQDRKAMDEKIFRREMGRLEISLDSMPSSSTLRIAMTHFPPTDESGRETCVTEVLERRRVDICVFGHLHSLRLRSGRTWDFEKRGVRYVLASCDCVGFTPYLVTEAP